MLRPKKKEAVMSKKFDKCATCGDFHWTDQSCCPRYLVWVAGWHGDDDIATADIQEAAPVYAVNPEHAATRYAATYDIKNDYCVVGGDELQMVVWCPDGDKLTFCVRGKMVCSYDAEEITEKEGQQP
jgi:hypothetical protein